MTTTIGEPDLKEAAKEAAGNWQQFDCFAWFRQRDLEAPNDWALIYTHNRDSGLLDQSNAEAVAETMRLFTAGDDPDVVFESHDHWAVGHVDGFSIRVYRRGRITKAFRTWHNLQTRMADYAVLDDEDYSAREYDATLENIADAAWRAKREYNLHEEWESDVYSWLSDHDSSEIENVDDRGGYPSEDSLRRAFDALGYERIAEE